jgi:hypothetical protein
LISVKSALGIEVVTSVALGREMIDQGRPILYARLFPSYQMGKVVIMREIVTRFGDDAVQFAAQPAMFDAFDLTREFDPAVPDFQRGKLCQSCADGCDRLLQ